MDYWPSSPIRMLTLSEFDTFAWQKRAFNHSGTRKREEAILCKKAFEALLSRLVAGYQGHK
jgi:hypothetical protein